MDSLLERVEPDLPLLVLIDCLVLLITLQRWGRIDFWPNPEDVKHFDVISLCIFVCVQPCLTTLFVVPFPLPTPQGRWDPQLRDKPETEIRGLR